MNANYIVVPDDFRSIQDAINSAGIGSTIVVKAGLYTECLIIDKSLTLVGENGATIISQGRDHTVKITANNVSFSGFVLKGVERSLWSGVYIRSLYNVVENNTITDHCYGIHIYDSSHNFLRNNKIYGNTYNLEVWGLVLQHFVHDIDSTNKVDQKPVCYWVDKHDVEVPLDAGYVAIVNCSNVVVGDLTLSNNGEGVLFAYALNSTISNVTVVNNRRGIRLLSSDSNLIVNNSITRSEWCGVTIDASMDNTLKGNVISENRHHGIVMSYSSLLPYFSKANMLVENEIFGNNYGLFFDTSSDSVVCWNVLSNYFCNIVLKDSASNVFYGNSIKGSKCGVQVQHSSNNSVCNNNFGDNLIQVEVKDFLSINKWYDGYPSGGNSWSDYGGVDAWSGPYQNVTGNDGIGDSPYVIDRNNRDDYPLMGTFSEFVVCWEGQKFSLATVCNSTISNFRFDSSKKMISFNVAGLNDSLGFCRIAILTDLIKSLWNNCFVVLVDGKEPVTMRNWTEDTGTYLYFTYIHSTREVVIMPEFSLWPYGPALVVLVSFLSIALVLFVAMFRKSVRRQGS